VAFFAPRARESAIVLDLKIEPGVPAIVNGDQARLAEILTNLVGNALKFTDRGRVTVGVNCAHGELPEILEPVGHPALLPVTDTGIGIPAEKIADLFKPFNQVDASAHRRRGGTGLGLIISKRLCELMGGTISVESHLGEGSTFRFSILADYQRGDTATPFAPTNPKNKAGWIRGSRRSGEANSVSFSPHSVQLQSGGAGRN